MFVQVATSNTPKPTGRVPRGWVCSLLSAACLYVLRVCAVVFYPGAAFASPAASDTTGTATLSRRIIIIPAVPSQSLDDCSSWQIGPEHRRTNNYTYFANCISKCWLASTKQHYVSYKNGDCRLVLDRWRSPVRERMVGGRAGDVQVSRCCKGVKNAVSLGGMRRGGRRPAARENGIGWKYHYIGKAPCKAPAQKKLTVPKGQKNRGNLTAENNKNWEMDFELCSRPSRRERNGTTVKR